MAYRVLEGLVTAWRFADWPTSRSPLSEKATMLGVVRAPSAFSMTLTSLPSMMATQELVVPRSMPITLLIVESSVQRTAAARSTADVPRLDMREMYGSGLPRARADGGIL